MNNTVFYTSESKMKTQIIFAVCCYIITTQAFSLNKAEKCTADNCQIENNCRCSSATSPIEKDQTPQFVIITVDESLVNSSYINYWKELLNGRSNPDGNPISATFFVPHEYTDYEVVNKLYNQGFEIADYWINNNSSQRIFISTFANIPIEDIIGVRTHYLQGDVTIDAYVASGLQYDNSCSTRSNQGLWPYTLDYLSTQTCGIVESHPGFWMVPLSSIQGKGGMECVALNGCQMEGNADDIANWLLGEVERVRNSTKTPVTIVVNSVFLLENDNLAGFGKFLDGLATLPDVFLTSHNQLIDWVKNPVPFSEFKTTVPDRNAECNPVTCALTNEDSGLTYYVRLCVPCPDIYPSTYSP